MTNLPVRSPAKVGTIAAPQVLTSISAAADGSVWAADGSSTLYRVVSGGVGSNNGWAAPVPLGLNSLSAAADGSVWAVRDGKQVLVYADGGWQPHPSPVPAAGM